MFILALVSCYLKDYTWYGVICYIINASNLIVFASVVWDPWNWLIEGISICIIFKKVVQGFMS